MKKIIFLFISFLVICLTACGNAASNSSEMLEIIKEKENISAEIAECGTVIDNGEVLIVGVTGENDKTHNYYAAQFSSKKKGKYQFEKIISLYEIGWQIRLCKWQEGYVIICNNAEVEKMQIVITKNDEEQIKIIDVEKMPMVYHLDMSDAESGYNIKYTFFDSHGNEVY